MDKRKGTATATVPNPEENSVNLNSVNTNNNENRQESQEEDPFADLVGEPEEQPVVDFDDLLDESSDTDKQEEKEKKERLPAAVTLDFGDWQYLAVNGLLFYLQKKLSARKKREFVKDLLVKEIQELKQEIRGQKEEEQEKKEEEKKTEEKKEAEEKPATILIGPAVFVVAAVEHQNGKRTFEIRFTAGNNTETKHVLEEMDIKEIERVTGKFVTKTEYYKQYLLLAANEAPLQRVITTTGWNEKYTQFYHPAVQYSNIRYNLRNLEAYLPVNPEKQHLFIKQHLEQGKILGLLYLISAANIFLVEKTKPALVLVNGTAKVGKTLATTLATNLFYNATDLQISAFSTHVALELMMRNMKNMPILIDEAALKTFDFENLVFMVHQQKGKARGTKELKVNISDLNSFVFLTSELVETEQAKRAGATRRLLDFSIKQWNDISSVEQDIAIKNVNYCGAGADYIKKIIAEKSLAKYLKTAEKESMPRGMEQIFIPIWSAFYFLQDFYSLKLVRLADKLLLLAEEKHKEIQEKTDLETIFLEKFPQWLAKNPIHFQKKVSEIDAEKWSDIRAERWGKIDKNNVYVICSVFINNFCTEEKLNHIILLDLLQEKGILIPAAGNRKAKPVRMDDIVASCYHFTLPENVNMDN